MEKLEEAWQRAAAKQAGGSLGLERDAFRSRLSPGFEPCELTSSGRRAQTTRRPCSQPEAKPL